MRDVAIDDHRIVRTAGPGPRFHAWLPSAAHALVVALPVLFVIGRSVADVALVLVALGFLLWSALEHAWGWLKTPWVRLALAIWVFLTLASPLSDDPGATLGRALPFVRFVLFAAALQHWLLPDPGVRRHFLLALGGVIAFVVLDSVLQFATGSDLFGLPQAQDGRLSGPFGDNVPGTFLAKTSLPVLGAFLGWSATRGRGRGQVAVIGLAAALAGTIALTGERMAFLTFGLGLAFAVLFTAAFRRLLLAGALVVAVAVTGTLAVSPDLRDRYIGDTAADLDGFWGGRYGHIFVRAVGLWQAEPVFGVGLKQFREHCARDDFEAAGPVEEQCFSHPHNVWLEWLAEGGGIAFLAFALLVALWVRELSTAYAGWSAPPLAVGACAAVLVFLWPFQSTMSFFTNWNAILFWLMLGLALAVCRPRDLHGRPLEEAPVR